jgi:hypothetical protein
MGREADDGVKLIPLGERHFRRALAQFMSTNKPLCADYENMTNRLLLSR